ncbi:MAG: family 16 glycoside hydrolase [Bryobacteraceae bacterium]
MSARQLTRRTFVGSIAATGLATGKDGWVDLFDGQSLNGWRPSEKQDSWKVDGGHLTAGTGRSHLFYSGPVQDASFKNFEFEAEVLSQPGCNSGIFFHTLFDEGPSPRQGFEVQIDNKTPWEHDYCERKKTGSLYGIRNVYKQLVADDEWFTLYIAVHGKNVQIRVNGVLVVDYTEFNPPALPTGTRRKRYLSRGTFALQCHDDRTKVRFRRIRVRPLSDDEPTPGPASGAADDVEQQVIALAWDNVPVVDYHVHLKAGLTMEQALAKSRRDGIQYGIAVNCGKGFPIQDDETVLRALESMKGNPVFFAMQAEGREWTSMFSRRAAAKFDYIFTDSMTWTDNRGRRMRLWIPEEVGAIADPQEFMETLVERAVGILTGEPIDIYVNPTFLPNVIANDYDTLWTVERMRKVAEAAVKNGVAVEINSRYKLPSRNFLKIAKEAGCKFAFGTNNGGPADLGRSEYGLQMVKELGLSWKDFFVPGAWGPKAIDRKPGALRA